MTATDELRRMLDERGVKWWDSSDDNVLHTTWNDMNCWFNEFPDGWTAWGMAKRGTPEQAIAATLGRPTWRNSYDQQRYDRWYNSLFHGEPSSFYELIESVIWTTETVDLGPNGNECQGVDEGEVYTKRLIESWAKLAATLGSELPYDELLRCLENDWHISASWDGLRKFWCIELTEEGVKLRNSAHGTLTAEQVRTAIFNGSSYASHDGAKYYADGIGMQAIAEELNAELGCGECKVESSVGIEFDTLISPDFFEFEMGCGYRFRWSDNEPPDYCPGCGRKVMDE